MGSSSMASPVLGEALSLHLQNSALEVLPLVRSAYGPQGVRQPTSLSENTVKHHTEPLTDMLGN